MKFKNFPIKTPLFLSGTSALFASLEKIQINLNSKIGIPDYYCEEAIINLCSNFEVCFYSVDNNLFPDEKSFNKILQKDIDVIILVQYFNFSKDLQPYIDKIKKHGKYVIIDAIHLFFKNPEKIYLNVDALIYSLKKPFYLNEGACVYTNNKLLKINLCLASFGPKRNILSFLKLIRFLLCLIPFLNLSNLYAKESSSILNLSTSIQPANFISILIFKLLIKTSIIEFINKNFLVKLKKRKIIRFDNNILNFAFEKSEIKKSNIEKSFFWPLPINKKRSSLWTKNANKIFKSKKLIYPYFKF
tara:strand:- start:4840 stop:5745 length:906 start_codon:yes stop_codon:yes gene_type:complete